MTHQERGPALHGSQDEAKQLAFNNKIRLRAGDARSAHRYQPPLPRWLSIRCPVSTARLEVGWNDPQPASGMVLCAAYHSTRRAACPVRIPLGLLVALWQKPRVGEQTLNRAWETADGLTQRTTVRADERCLLFAEEGERRRELSIHHTTEEAFRTAVGWLLAMSERTVSVPSMLPSWCHAKEGSPCPTCGAIRPPSGKARSCLISQGGFVICRNSSNGSVCEVIGRENQVLGFLWPTGAPLTEVLVIRDPGNAEAG